MADVIDANLVKSVTAKKKEIAAALQYTATTAELAAIGNAINTTGKFVGKMVFNTTTGKPVFAVSAAAGGVWNDAAGTLAHTPV